MRTKTLWIAVVALVAGAALAAYDHEGVGRSAATRAKKAHIQDLKKLLRDPVCRQTGDDRKHLGDEVTEHGTFNAPDESPCFGDVRFSVKHEVRPCPKPLFGKIHLFEVRETLLQRTETGYHPDGSIKDVRCHLGKYLHRKEITCCSEETQTEDDWLPGEVLDDGTPARWKPGMKPRFPGDGVTPPDEPPVPPQTPTPPPPRTPDPPKVPVDPPKVPKVDPAPKVPSGGRPGAGRRY